MDLQIDIGDEELLTLAEAAKRLPGRPALVTVWRWCVHGVRGTKLAHVRLGRRLYTTTGALNRFAQRCARSDLERREDARKEAERILREASI